ncbi:MAG: hypothetical protein K2K30_02165 [Alistipes sp.]|nr:hypothetical protein [Alistipes sp.]
MKKLLFSLMLCMLGSAAFADNDINKKEGPREELQIADILTPAGPTILRMPMWYAEAWIDYTMNCLEVEINQLLGPATVVITDLMTGQTVAAATIEPDYSTVAYLPLPAEGFYRMTIKSAEYLGESNFTIE